MTTKPPSAPTTAAFHLQAVISFGLSLLAVAVALWNMPADPWIRAFLAVSVLWVTTSAFTLAKVVRDRQESPRCSAAWTRPGSTSCWPSTTRSGWRARPMGVGAVMTDDSARFRPIPRPTADHERAGGPPGDVS